MILLTTGSRLIKADLVPRIHDPLYDVLGEAVEAGERLQVWHGKCETGADRWVGMWCHYNGFMEGHGMRSFPADWHGPCKPTCRQGHRLRNDTCPAAGPYRNQEMVDELAKFKAAGEVVKVIAWVLGTSDGTIGTLRKVWAAGMDATVIGLG